MPRSQLRTTKPSGTHRHGRPAPEPIVIKPPSEAGRLPMLPDEPRDWWATPDAAAALLTALREPDPAGDTCGTDEADRRDQQPPGGPVFTPVDLEVTWTDLPPVTGKAAAARNLAGRWLP